MNLEALSAPHIPGHQVRLRLLDKGAEWERKQIVDKLNALIAARKASGQPFSQTISFDELLTLINE